MELLVRMGPTRHVAANQNYKTLSTRQSAVYLQPLGVLQPSETILEVIQSKLNNNLTTFGKQFIPNPTTTIQLESKLQVWSLSNSSCAEVQVRSNRFPRSPPSNLQRSRCLLLLMALCYLLLLYTVVFLASGSLICMFESIS